MACCLIIIGLITCCTHLSINTFEYIGQPANSNTHLLTLGGYRHYNPAQGTFLKQDSYSPFATNRTFNGFNYSDGNPIMFRDLNGHLGKKTVADIETGTSIVVHFFAVIMTIICTYEPELNNPQDIQLAEFNAA